MAGELVHELTREECRRLEQDADDRAYAQAWSDMKNDVTVDFAFFNVPRMNPLGPGNVIMTPIRMYPWFDDLPQPASDLVLSIIRMYGNHAVQKDDQWVVLSSGDPVDVLTMYQMGLLLKTCAPGMPTVAAYKLGSIGTPLAATLYSVAMVEGWDILTGILDRMHRDVLWSLKNLNGTHAIESMPEGYDEYVWLTPSGDLVSRVALQSVASCWIDVQFSDPADEDGISVLKLNRRGRWLCGLLAPVFKRMEG